MKRLVLLLIFASATCFAGMKGKGTGYIVYGDGSSACTHCLPHATSYTQVYWIKPTNTAPSGNGAEMEITCEVSGCGTFQNYWNSANSHITCNSGATTIDLGAVTTGVWAHVACVWTGSNLVGYINGVQKATAALSSSPAGVAGLMTLWAYIPTPAAFSNDTLAEAAYYNNKTLTVNEIKALVSGANPDILTRPSVYTPLWGTGFASNFDADLSGALQSTGGTPSSGTMNYCPSTCSVANTGLQLGPHPAIRPFSTEEEAQGGQ